MSVRTLKLSDFARQSPCERSKSLAEFSRQQPLNGEVSELQSKIAAYEMRYEMSSSTMLSSFRAGQLKETADIGSWLILLSIRDSISEANV